MSNFRKIFNLRGRHRRPISISILAHTFLKKKYVIQRRELLLKFDFNKILTLIILAVVWPLQVTIVKILLGRQFHTRLPGAYPSTNLHTILNPYARGLPNLPSFEINLCFKKFLILRIFLKLEFFKGWEVG